MSDEKDTPDPPPEETSGSLGSLPFTSLEDFRGLLENLGVGFGVIDPSETFLFANPTGERIFGASPGSLAGRNVSEFVDRETFARIELEMEKRRRGEVSTYEIDIARPDGEQRRILLTSAPSFGLDGALAYTLGLFLDVTERVRAEKALRELVDERTRALQREVSERRRAEKAARESEGKFRAVVEQSRDGFYLADIETGGILEANPALQQLLGYSREEFKALTLFDVVGHPRDDILERIREVVEDGTHSIGERQWRRKDKSLVDVEVSVDLISFGGRKAFCVVGRDISERKSAQEEKLRLQTQLLQSQKMEAIGILAGGIAHDFNNLLTTILGQTELALEMLEKDNPVLGHLEDAHQASMRAANLTRQILLFSRRQPMDMTRINVNRSIDNLLNMLRRFIGEDIALRTDLDPGLWPVRADEGNVEQVIINLAVNARDAMPEGGALTIRTENVRFEEKDVLGDPEAKAGRFVRITLTDTGSGMDPAVLERVFEPFFSTKAAGKGTGLGLSVVYGIIKQHEGWIRVESEPGRGTRFRVFLPALSGYTEEIPTEPASMKDFRGSGERILLVEDGLGVRNFASKALRENGYTVFEASSTREALQIFEREREVFDLVFSDVVLPDRTGIQLVDILLSRVPELRVLLTSGYVDHKSQWPLIRERGFRFLQKPYTLFDLLSHIREVIEAG